MKKEDAENILRKQFVKETNHILHDYDNSHMYEKGFHRKYVEWLESKILTNNEYIELVKLKSKIKILQVENAHLKAGESKLVFDERKEEKINKCGTKLYCPMANHLHKRHKNCIKCKYNEQG